MSRIYKTAGGQAIDLDQLILKNENVISVGNMNVNAAGDELGPGGKVATNRNEVMDRYYRLNTAKAVDDYAPIQKAKEKNATEALIPNQKSENLLEEDPYAEGIEAAPVTQTPNKKLRGNLADSIAKQTVIEQPEILPPGTTRGPRRI